MPHSNLLKRIKTDYPHITFVNQRSFRWSPSTQTIFFNSSKDHWRALLLHEVAHAELDHDEAEIDIERIKKEVLAWGHVKNILGPRYEIAFNEDVQEDALDTYRRWLNKRSLCPGCKVSGLQTKTDTYECLACKCQWSV